MKTRAAARWWITEFSVCSFSQIPHFQFNRLQSILEEPVVELIKPLFHQLLIREHVSLVGVEYLHIIDPGS